MSVEASAPSRTAPGEAPGLLALRKAEADLEREWSRLQQQGNGFQGVRASLADGEHAEQECKERLRTADLAQTHFLSRLDDFQRRIHAYFMDQVVRELDRAMETMEAFYGRRNLGRIAWRYRRLQRLAGRYRSLESLYGTAGDHRRIAVYQRFYAGVVAFSKQIRGLDPTMPRSAPSAADRLYAIGHGLLRAIRRTPALARLIGAAVRVLHSVLSTRNDGAGKPFTRRVDDLFRAWGDVKGYGVEVSGRENLPPATPQRQGTGRTLHLLTPTHRHGVTDNVTFAHLGVADHLVFNAVDQLPLLPRFLKKRVADTPGLIPVGGGRGPAIDRALEALALGTSDNVLIYPEGSVSEGFRGTHPPRRNFGEGLVRRLREAGYELRLQPITYLDNARFLDLPPRSASAEDRRLRVVVSPSLDSAAIDALVDSGGGEMLNRVLRLAWLGELTTDERMLLGHDRVREIERRLDLELDGIRYWGSLESAPVGDRLETNASEPLRVREEPFHGKRVRVFEVPESAFDADGRVPIRNLQEEDSMELLIGIRPPSHIYLNVGSTRFDGDIFRPLAVKERDSVFRGIVIRFVGVPVKSIHAIRRKLDALPGRERRTLTCANSACQVIARAANIKIDDHADMRPFLPSHVLPTRTIRKLIERGVRNHAGDAVEVQIYKTDPRPLQVILAEARREEMRIAADHLRGISIDLWRASVARLRAILAHLRRDPPAD